MTTSTKPKILFIANLNTSLPEYNEFKTHFEIINYTLTTTSQLITDLGGSFKDIVGIYAGWAGFVPLGGLKPEIIKNFPDSLKVITCCSVGYDSYDVNALKNKGIQLYNTPSLGASHVADLVLWHVLESFRRFSTFQDKTRELGHCVKVRGSLEGNKPGYPFGHVLSDEMIQGPGGKKCGILGFGKIGKMIGKRCDALGMRIYYHKRSELTDDEVSKLGYDASYLSLDELMKCDVIIIACPGNALTMNLINRDMLDLCTSSTKIINVGRGFILDEAYLIERLIQGEIGFVGLDVYTNEPVIDERLLKRTDVSLTPHIGSSTEDVFNNTAIFCLKNLYSVLVNGKDGESRVV